MTIPQSPPEFDDLYEAVRRVGRPLVSVSRTSPGGKYLHWDELRRREPPEGLTHDDWWIAIKLARLTAARRIPLTDAAGRPFSYSMPDEVQEGVHQIDQRASGQISTSESVTNPTTRDRYIISSLIEEAITSSQLEGASTSRQVAKEMIKSGRKPRDKSERMILNNYAAMNYVRERRRDELTPEFIRELHRIVTDGTLDDPDTAGMLQQPDEERVRVFDPVGELLHTPPPAEQLPERLEALCRFANGEETEGFLHPVVRAIIVHFWLA